MRNGCGAGVLLLMRLRACSVFCGVEGGAGWLRILLHALPSQTKAMPACVKAAPPVREPCTPVWELCCDAIAALRGEWFRSTPHCTTRRAAPVSRAHVRVCMLVEVLAAISGCHCGLRGACQRPPLKFIYAFCACACAVRDCLWVAGRMAGGLVWAGPPFSSLGRQTW
jgi:hypothetical protein